MFYNQILEVTSHHFCHVLFIGNKSVGPAHTQRERVMEKSEYQEIGMLGTILEAASLIWEEISIHLLRLVRKSLLVE